MPSELRCLCFVSEDGKDFCLPWSWKFMVTYAFNLIFSCCERNCTDSEA